MTRSYDSGPPCRICGKARINVEHDGPMERARNIEVWAMPTPGMGGKDYYEWACVQYHQFEPVDGRMVPVASDYDRGYQAGYHAGMRKSRVGYLVCNCPESGTSGSCPFHDVTTVPK